MKTALSLTLLAIGGYGFYMYQNRYIAPGYISDITGQWVVDRVIQAEHEAQLSYLITPKKNDMDIRVPAYVPGDPRRDWNSPNSGPKFLGTSYFGPEGQW